MRPNGEMDIDGLRPPNVRDFRVMRAGEMRIFRIGKNGSITLAASVAAKTGGRFTQRLVLIVDPKTATARRVFAVTCLEPVPKPMGE